MKTSSHTQDLIDLLVADLKPVRRGALARGMAGGVGAGALVSLALVLLLWGPRPDWSEAVVSASFWAKAAFTLALAGSGFAALLRLARPRGAALGAVVAGLAVVVAMGAAAGLQLLVSPPATRLALLLGATWAVCPWLIMALAAPILCGTLRALRAMAPTRLGLAGAAAGLTAGALSAFVYALSCNEHALPFVFVWYGLAIAAVTAAGAALGSKLLRW